MSMVKIYSDVTNAFYNTAEEAQKAEEEHAAKLAAEKAKKEQEIALAKQKKEQALAERKAAAEKVETARKAMNEAQKVYKDELSKFVDKYHTYHFSTSDPNEIPTLFDLFENVFKF